MIAYLINIKYNGQVIGRCCSNPRIFEVLGMKSYFNFLTCWHTYIYIAFYWKIFHIKYILSKIGVLMGLSVGLIFLSLMTAIFWGQLSDCKEIAFTVSAYSCSHRNAMKSISVFSSFSFIVEVSKTKFRYK